MPGKKPGGSPTEGQEGLAGEETGGEGRGDIGRGEEGGKERAL